MQGLLFLRFSKYKSQYFVRKFLIIFLKVSSPRPAGFGLFRACHFWARAWGPTPALVGSRLRSVQYTEAPPVDRRPQPNRVRYPPGAALLMQHTSLINLDSASGRARRGPSLRPHHGLGDFFHSVNAGGKTRNVRTCSFLSAAEPSDLGALGVLLLLVVVVGGHFWLPMCSF